MAVIPPVESADLIISAIPAPAREVFHYEPLTYLVKIRNAGPNAARNVALTYKIPVGFQNIFYSRDDWKSYRPWPAILQLGTLPAGSEITIAFRGTAAGRPDTTIDSTFTVSSTTTDPETSNNCASHWTIIKAPF